MENILQSIISINMLLGVHIAGAIITGAFSLAALSNIMLRRVASYYFYAKSIALFASFQILTGSLLTILATTKPSLFTFCNKVVLYFLLIAFVEGVLFYEIKRNSKEALLPVRFLTTSLAIVMPVALLAAWSTIL